jgi:hypothetical protein
MDGKKWISCDSCEKWSHTDCEVERTGTADKDMREIAAEFSRKQDAGEDEDDMSDGNYWCLTCRNKKQI